MSEGEKVIERLTGEITIYPGHPLVLAVEIISIFPTPFEALERTQSGLLQGPRAVLDDRISGGGGEAYNASNLIRMAVEGTSAEDLIEWADKVWINTAAGGEHAAIEPGLEQANKLKPLFEKLLKAWLERAGRIGAAATGDNSTTAQRMHC